MTTDQLVDVPLFDLDDPMPCTSSTLTVGSLCTGAGGLDMAVGDVLGDLRHAWLSEVDTGASRVLAERFSDVPNLGDVRAVDWPRVEPVDVLVAGYPCQDFSSAGKRAGMEGARGAIWFEVARAIGLLRPRVVFLENVDAHVVRGFPRVLGDLSEMGYDATWGVVRASDVGAPHQRARLFIVAQLADAHGEPIWEPELPERSDAQAAIAGGLGPGVGLMLMPTPCSSAQNQGPNRPDWPHSPNLITAMALLPTPCATDVKAGDVPRRHHGGNLALPGAVTLLPTPRASDGAKGGPNQRGSSGDLMLTPAVMQPAGRWAQYAPAIARWEGVIGRPAPEPTIIGKRGGTRLSGRFVEWLMGWPDGWVTDLVDNTAALRICGNGVVRQQGAAAFRQLLAVA